MELNRTTRRRLRLQAGVFAVLFLSVITMLAWLSTRYHHTADWTASGRHTLSAASAALLKRMDGPIRVTAFAHEAGLGTSRLQIRDLLGRYQRAKADLQLEFVNPDLAPERVRRAGVTVEGELIVEYGGRTEHVQSLTEEALTNALQRLTRQGARRVLFLSGHGERSPTGEGNHDLSLWAKRLRSQGFLIDTVNLANTLALPEHIAVLVLAGPQVELLPGEVKLITDYVRQGGNLLWLTDPGGHHGLGALAETLGIRFVPGMVVDPTTQMLGIDNPAFVIVADYPRHPLTRNLNAITLYPQAQALELQPEGGWQGKALLRTAPRSWSEAVVHDGPVSFDASRDRPGPLTIGITLSRPAPDGGSGAVQRVVVIGDGDFLSNAYLGNGVNLPLGTRIMNWLSHDDALISIPPKGSPDRQLALTSTAAVIIGFGFLVLLPGLLAGSGFWIWYRRRHR